MKLLRNRIVCKHCGDIIESKHVHEYVKCGCGKVAVDGGLEYGKRAFPELPPEDHYVDISEYENEEETR